jgi:hypothetical protein
VKVAPKAPPIAVELVGSQIVSSCELQAEDGSHVAYGIILRMPGPMRLVAFWWDRYASPPTWASRDVELADLIGPAPWRG